MNIEHEADARAERKAIFAKRKGFHETFGAFVRTMREALSQYLGMRAQGVDRSDAVRGLEAVIRDVWPKPTTQYGPACLDCDDVGYVEYVCTFGKWCARPTCRGKGAEWEHRYVEPCVCPKGDRFRPRAASADDAVASVARVGKPKRGGWSRAGA